MSNVTRGNTPVPTSQSLRGKRRRTRRYFPILLLLICLACLWAGVRLGTRPAPSSSAANEAASGTAPRDTLPPIPETIPPEDAWALLLVNKDNPLPEDFAVPDLTQLINGNAIDSRAYPDLQEMMDDAQAAGLQPLICSSYRTNEYQEQLYNNKVQEYLDTGLSRDAAEEQASMWVAPPGTSEHQTGLAVDIVDENYQLLDETQEDTPIQQWLLEHAWEYGFILRYPTEKSGITGVAYEPWHYRYVGKAAAELITAQGLCLEEHLSQIAPTTS